ncbi:NADH dehydrogenase subunit N [Halopenitus malekzadehii]|uniref:NADH dehydrogenase subunit N n=1 Tax=Halopenitus malekzadehii TaxID=1267564 RepID=A0A1H6HZD9_9EURY|nr:NADH-quinone oxidoreductase subunit N [Halopenitus malekzadehii]SEH40491.1 NADH dehydrogenase subunit N [Halopenitus malekzadehii]
MSIIQSSTLEPLAALPAQTGGAPLPEWTALGPILALVATGLLLLGWDTVFPNRRTNTELSVIAAVGALVTLALSGWYLAAGTGRPATGGAITLFAEAITIDGLALFFTAIVAVVTALVAVASRDYLDDHETPGEFYSLVVLAAAGMALLASASSLATIFVALEMVSLPSYALVAYLKEDRGSVEAGMKYFLVGAVSSAIFVFGISLVYAATGSLVLSDVAAAFGDLDDLAGVAGVGVVMMIGGFAFKTASVPVHFWAPEVYEGAPAPVSAFLSSASKAAGFAVAFRVFTEAFPIADAVAVGIDWPLVFAVLAVLTMTLGNFAAAVQTEVKRMLAYSSIGHAGYALIGLAALSAGGSHNGAVMGASMAHLFVYGFMNTGAFLFIAMVESWGVGRTFEDYAGLGSVAPMASVAMTVFMFSLAGLPPFGGFFSKYFLFAGAVFNGFWWLAAIGALNSVLSLYYYSRVVKALWIEEPTDALSAVDSRPTALYGAVIVAAVATVVVLPGFGPVIETAEAAATALFG